ncbi:uncharacterized protein Hap1MRO34_009644 isoform 1-T4 [Clarias gariepinus]
MQAFWILLVAVHVTYSYAAITSAKTHHEQLMYGERLSIKLPVGAEKLQFTSPDETKQDVLWSRLSSPKRGVVTGRDDDRKFIIYSVTFDDQGIYTVVNFWGKKLADYLVKVVTKRSSQDCVAGETFKITLGDLRRNDATLHFSNEDFNLTLVKHGSPVGNSHPDYLGRIRVTDYNIEVLNVNVSDVGNYTLTDRLNRTAKLIFMNLVDKHPGIGAGPLAALLLLFGIPPCICCCCRKRICKKSGQTTTANTTTVKLDGQVIPPGPPPAYVSLPANPTPGYTPGYPTVGENIVHPPPNPTFPPQPQPPYSGYPAASPTILPNPAFDPNHSNQNPLYPPVSGFDPAQPPQWSGAPYNQPAPAGFSPVVYNAPSGPQPVNAEINPTTPLLTPPQPQNPAQYTGPDVLKSSDSNIQFNINKATDTSANFL